MQLKPQGRKRGKIASSLAAATCSLLCASQAGASIAAEEAPATQESEKAWTYDTAIQYYGEADRVTDISANLLATRSWLDGRAFTFKIGVDTLTGASANGAAPAQNPQTFTGPSGSAYTVDARSTPLDPTFLDTRVAASVNYSQPVNDRMRAAFGVTFSTEYDYLHGGFNGRLDWDFNQRSTTLTLGAAYALDIIDPVGGAPIGLSDMRVPGNNANKLGQDSKTIGDLLIGVTQVVGKRTICQFNYALSRADGYQTDPYKIISVVDPVTGDNVPGFGPINLYLHEKRPDVRTKHALYGQVRHALHRDIFDISYRYMTDDWGVRSHTIDLRYRLRYSGFYVQPHVRYYLQNAADFYAPVLFDGDPLPRHATADYRMGDLAGATIGVKYGYPFGQGREWSLRFEYYQQSGTSPPEYSVGSLQGLDLFPDVDALIFQGGYRF